ncbi:helix-hairpin-helix domain-containing protein [Candidatus Sumerlaeota bacterium]|nr:helix-hairpin-helix domain-containing protein [Candidatus Sumerlaeota bacterium]
MMPRLISLMLLMPLAISTMAQQPGQEVDFTSLIKDLANPNYTPRPRHHPYDYSLYLPPEAATGAMGFLGTDVFTTHAPVAEVTTAHIDVEPIDPITVTDGQLALLEETWVININTASPALLARVPYLDHRRAGAIALHRAVNGPFTRITEITEVFGITEFTLTQLQDHLICQGQTTFDGLQDPESGESP